MLKLKNFNLSLGIHVFVLISKIVGKTFTIKIVLDGFLYKKSVKQYLNLKWTYVWLTRKIMALSIFILDNINIFFTALISVQKKEEMVGRGNKTSQVFSLCCLID